MWWMGIMSISSFLPPSPPWPRFMEKEVQQLIDAGIPYRRQAPIDVR